MRLAFPFLISLTLAGCISQSGRTGPGKVPSDALGAMYTDISPEEIAACFARTLGVPIRIEGTRLLITSIAPHSVVYDVGPNAIRGDYPTEVIIRGMQNSIEQQKLGTCFTSHIQYDSSS